MGHELTVREVGERIYFVRGHRVMLDTDLAELYGVETKRLNEQVRRNPERFPPDFMFRLTVGEWKSLRSQNATLKPGAHRKYLPYVFTEHGALMLANVLNSERAAQTNKRASSARVRALAPTAFIQCRTGSQTGISGEKIRHPVQTGVRRHSRINGTTSRAETGNGFSRKI